MGSEMCIRDSGRPVRLDDEEFLDTGGRLAHGEWVRSTEDQASPSRPAGKLRGTYATSIEAIPAAAHFSNFIRKRPKPWPASMPFLPSVKAINLPSSLTTGSPALYPLKSVK